MVNLKSFELFESSLEITKEDIKRLPSYKVLTEVLGLLDITTDRVWKNQNLTFSHPRAEGYQYSVTNTGYVRRIPIGGTPGVIQSFPPISSLSDWDNNLMHLAKYVLKNILKLKDDLINHVSVRNKSIFSSEVFNVGGAENYRFFLSMYQKMTQEDKNKTLGLIGMTEDEVLKIIDATLKVHKLKSLGYF